MPNRWRLVSFRGGKTAFPRPFTYLNYSCKPDIAKHRLYLWLCYGFLCKNCRLLRIFDEDRVLFTYFCLKNAKNVRTSCFCLDIITNYYAVIAGTSCSHDENAVSVCGHIPMNLPRVPAFTWWHRACSLALLREARRHPLIPNNAFERHDWNPWCLITNIHY